MVMVVVVLMVMIVLMVMVMFCFWLDAQPGNRIPVFVAEVLHQPLVAEIESV